MVRLPATPHLPLPHTRRYFQLLGAVLTVLAVGLSGCGGDDGGDAPAEPAEAASTEPAESAETAPDAPAEPAEAASTEPAESAETAPAEPAGPVGVSDDRVLFGQSAAFSGPAQELGSAMKLGIEAAFHEQNQAGGVHGRRLELIALDDLYEPDDAYTNTLRLIDDEGVFALIGEVGTPTSRSAYPLAHARACRSWRRSPEPNSSATRNCPMSSTCAPRTTRRRSKWWPASPRTWA